MSIVLRKGLTLSGSLDYNDLENKPAIDGVELTENTTKADLGLDTIYTFKGQVDTYDDLPKTGNRTGDTYNVKDTGENYSWDGSNWDCLSGSTTVYFNNNTLQSGGVDITIDADKNTLSNIETDNFKSGVIQTTLRASSSAKNTSIATEKAVRTALDTGIKSITDVIDTYGDIVTHNASEFATAAQGAKADTAVQDLDDLGITATATELNYCDGVTSNIQTQLNNKQPTITNLSTIESNAAAGKSAADTIATYGDVVTHDADEFATSAQGTKADSSIQGVKLSGNNLTPDENKNIDIPYATSGNFGVIKTSLDVNTITNNNGVLIGVTTLYKDYAAKSNTAFITKGTLENVITGKELANKVVDVRVNGTSVLNDKVADITITSYTPLKFTNVVASNWVSDATYSDYPYSCTLTCTGVTSTMVPQVVYGITEATSGNYAPVCLSGTDTVTVYSKVNSSITIQSITVF